PRKLSVRAGRSGAGNPRPTSRLEGCPGHHSAVALVALARDRAGRFGQKPDGTMHGVESEGVGAPDRGAPKNGRNYIAMESAQTDGAGGPPLESFWARRSDGRAEPGGNEPASAARRPSCLEGWL